MVGVNRGAAAARDQCAVQCKEKGTTDLGHADWLPCEGRIANLLTLGVETVHVDMKDDSR